MFGSFGAKKIIRVICVHVKRLKRRRCFDSPMIFFGTCILPVLLALLAMTFVVSLPFVLLALGTGLSTLLFKFLGQGPALLIGLPISIALLLIFFEIKWTITEHRCGATKTARKFRNTITRLTVNLRLPEDFDTIIEKDISKITAGNKSPIRLTADFTIWMIQQILPLLIRVRLDRFKEHMQKSFHKKSGD